MHRRFVNTTQSQIGIFRIAMCSWQICPRCNRFSTLRNSPVVDNILSTFHTSLSTNRRATRYPIQLVASVRYTKHPMTWACFSSRAFLGIHFQLKVEHSFCACLWLNSTGDWTIEESTTRDNPKVWHRNITKHCTLTRSGWAGMIDGWDRKSLLEQSLWMRFTVLDWKEHYHVQFQLFQHLIKPLRLCVRTVPCSSMSPTQFVLICIRF